MRLIGESHGHRTLVEKQKVSEVNCLDEEVVRLLILVY
jgi:hypothetical protein